jgi:ethanolamine utilization microcompartment shell protein EutS
VAGRGPSVGLTASLGMAPQAAPIGFASQSPGKERCVAGRGPSVGLTASLGMTPQAAPIGFVPQSPGKERYVAGRGPSVGLTASPGTAPQAAPIGFVSQSPGKERCVAGRGPSVGLTASLGMAPQAAPIGFVSQSPGEEQVSGTVFASRRRRVRARLGRQGLGLGLNAWAQPPTLPHGCVPASCCYCGGLAHGVVHWPHAHGRQEGEGCAGSSWPCCTS